VAIAVPITKEQRKNRKAGSLWVFKEFVGFRQQPAAMNFSTFIKVL
jgi:hypothetical protein